MGDRNEYLLDGTSPQRAAELGVLIVGRPNTGPRQVG